MKITDVRVTAMEAAPGAGWSRAWILVEVETDSGIVGLGDATNWPGGTAVVAALEIVAEHVIGEDPTRIEYLWHKMYRLTNYIGLSGSVVTAVSGIDIALWDIVGKSLNVPVHTLLGGRCRERVPVYANYWTAGLERTPEAYAGRAAEVVEAGFKALKFMPFGRLDSVAALALDRTLTPDDIAGARDLVAAVRAAVGPGIEIFIEAGGKLSPFSYPAFASAIAEFGISFVEEPLQPENAEAMARLAASSPIPIATGERLYTHHGVRRTLELGGVGLLQPDVVRTGGLTAARKIAAMADAYYVPIAPHNPNSPISTVASAHFGLATANFYMLEYLVDDVPWADELLQPSVRAVDGFIDVPDAPGLGVTLDRDVVARHVLG
jgi:galactonate dehydratase